MDVHVVIKGRLHELGYTYFQDISGCVIVEHKVGLVQKERPHYHIWLPGVPDVRSTKNALRAHYDTLDSNLKWNTHANAYYTVKEHNDFDAWLNYAWTNADCKLPELVLWNLPDPRPVRPFDELILPAQDGGIAGPTNYVVATEVASQPRKKQKTSEDKFNDFCNYCKSYYDENKDENIEDFKVKELLWSYSKGRFNRFRAAEYVYGVLYELTKSSGDVLTHDHWKEQWMAGIKL